MILCNVLVARWAADAGEFGRYAAAMSLSLILDAVLGTSIDLAVVRFGDMHAHESHRAESMHGAAFRFKAGVGVIIMAVAIGWGDRLAPMALGDGAGRGLFIMAVLSTVVLLLTRSTAVRLQSLGQFGRSSALDGAQGVLRLVAIAVPAFLGRQTADAFVAAHVAGSAAAFLGGFWLLPRAFLWVSSPPRADLREAATHAAITAGIVIAGTLTGRADVPIVAAARSAEDAGHYAVALQIATLLTLLASYYSVVMQPRILQLAKGGELLPALRWNLLWALGLTVVAAVGAIWALPTLLPGFFGARYVAAVPVAQVLLIGTCVDLLSMPILMVFGLQRFPSAALLGEGLIAIVFFTWAPEMASRSVIGIAWFVTGIRVAKLCLYGGITLVGQRRLLRTVS
ncbi:MAG TPA: hypothetical protein VIY56_07725 [Vicinamibacterales bacterium]